jgi:nucleotide-binding universal stress UspA family protein
MYAKILVCLDGSHPSLAGGRIALSMARSLGSELIASHIYDARLHTARFSEMEPVLPEHYREQSAISRLREAHKQLISEGFSALSLGYMEQFLEEAGGAGVQVTQAHREGRNYVELYGLLREMRPDLLVTGAYGLGRLEDRVGSTALRLLRLAGCDVLLARKAFPEKPRILVGIDGSAEALESARRAIQWARCFGGSISLAAAYDPAFHAQVFRTMGRSLSPSRQEEVGLNKQQELHDQIIDQGLGQLYRLFLDQASERCASRGFQAHRELLQGKAYRALVDHARSSAASLMVLGRFGHHRQRISPVGSNSEAAAQLASTNVLITRPPSAAPGDGAPPGERGEPRSLRWEQAAMEALERVPSFARPMARAAVEEAVRSEGGSAVSLDDFRGVAERFGMKPSGDSPRKESGDV